MREAAQPGYLSHSDAAAAPVGRVTDRQSLIVGHCPQCLPGAPLRVADRPVAFTKCGQYLDRQSLKPTLPSALARRRAT